MREIIEPLGIIAEFSIGLAGFTGIIAAITSASTGRAELQIFRFSNLLITAFAPGFFAILTICLVYAGMIDQQAIRLSSTMLLIYLCSWTIFVFKYMSRGSIKRSMGYFMWVFSLLNLVLQMTNIVAPAINLVGFYLFGLFVLLLQAAVVFSVLALATMRRSIEG